jgi:hypothetical protein
MDVKRSGLGTNNSVQRLRMRGALPPLPTPICSAFLNKARGLLNNAASGSLRIALMVGQLSSAQEEVVEMPWRNAERQSSL